MDPVPDPLLLRKSGSAGNRTRDLCICSQKLWPLDHRGGLHCTLLHRYIHNGDASTQDHEHYLSVKLKDEGSYNRTRLSYVSICHKVPCWRTYFICTNWPSKTLCILLNSESEDSFYPQILMEPRHESYISVIIRFIYIRFSVMRASHAAACRTTLPTIAVFTKVGSRDCKRFPPLTTGFEAQNKVCVSQINIYRCSSCFRYTTNCLSKCWCKRFVHPQL